jgi:uncharacterized protein YbaR (Trm112 family)
MSLPANFLELLRCPQSGQSLHYKNNELSSDASEYRYPIVGGVPWLLPHPRNSILDWGAKLNQFQQILLQEISQLDVDIKQARGLTRDRLQKLHAAKKTFLVEVTHLFEPLRQTKVAARETYNALLNRPPATQNLLSYEANIYRDWLWGDEENAISKHLLSSLFADKPLKFCVLGAGACRLAWDLHQLFEPELSVATDINPLFLLAVKKILSGDSFPLTEFPMQPKDLDAVAVAHQFKGLDQPAENFHLCFSDAAQSPFKPHAFDTVVTPWLIDIQPHELTKFLKRLNRYVPVGGVWINFGSLVFNQQRDSLCYSVDEIKERALVAGFEIEEIQQDAIPYLKSPYNAGYRIESVWAWRARKITDLQSDDSMQILPEWILDTALPIPREQNIVTAHAQYGFMNALHERINGNNSIRSLAEYFAKQQQADAMEFEQMLINYFMR